LDNSVTHEKIQLSDVRLQYADNDQLEGNLPPTPGLDDQSQAQHEQPFRQNPHLIQSGYLDGSNAFGSQSFEPPGDQRSDLRQRKLQHDSKRLQVPRYSQDIEEDDEVMVEQSDAEPDSPIVKNKQNGGVQSKSKGLQHEGGEVDSRTVRSNMTSKRRTNMRYSNADVDDDQVREAAEDDDMSDGVLNQENAITNTQKQAALASRPGGTGIASFNQ